jgi:orotidine-5'-phosphate decarboxylase
MSLSETTGRDPRKKRIIVALDLEDLAAAERLVKELSGLISFFKVGSELFSAAGPDAVRMVTGCGADAFLDLKYHDIPNTVSRAIRSAAGLGVSLVNVHTLGGVDMMRAAADMAREINPATRVIGVTVLTSMDATDLLRVGIDDAPEEAVTRLARLAREAGLAGVVSSAREVAQLREEFGAGFILVTPGIRPAGAESGDQKRIVTPAEAFAAGADYIVVGRPIAAAPDARAAAQSIIDEIGEIGE